MLFNDVSIVVVSLLFRSILYFMLVRLLSRYLVAEIPAGKHLSPSCLLCYPNYLISKSALFFLLASSFVVLILLEDKCFFQRYFFFIVTVRPV